MSGRSPRPPGRSVCPPVCSAGPCPGFRRCQGSSRRSLAGPREHAGRGAGHGARRPPGGGRQGVRPSGSLRQLLNAHDPGALGRRLAVGLGRGTQAAGEEAGPSAVGIACHTHTQLARRGPGGRAAELLLDHGESPAPPASPPSTRQRRARSLQPGMALQSLSEPRQDAAGPVSVPSRDRQWRGVRAVSSLHLSQENWAQPERQTQSQCCCPPVGWLSPKHEEQTPRGCGARGARWGRRCGGAAAAGAPRTCSRGNFYVPSALPQFFLRF